MAKVNGGLLSFDASGQIGKTLVFSRWKGRAYARRLVTPANPRSSEQTSTRSIFTWLNRVWKTAPADFQAPWAASASGQVLTDRNLWVKQNLSNLRDETDLNLLVFSPGAKGGLSIDPSIAGGSGTITIDLVAPSPLPAGWTIVEAVGAAILDQDPHMGTAYEVFVGSDATSTYQVVLSGLDPGDYQAAGWFVYQRSALLTDIAYGAATAEVVTVT